MTRRKKRRSWLKRWAAVAFWLSPLAAFASPSGALDLVTNEAQVKAAISQAIKQRYGVRPTEISINHDGPIIGLEHFVAEGEKGPRGMRFSVVGEVAVSKGPVLRGAKRVVKMCLLNLVPEHRI